MKTNSLLNYIKKSFPSVTKVKDAKAPLLVTVIDKDNAKATKKDPNNCALAQACKRQLHVDGVIIGLSFSYVVKGDKATRFKTSPGVGREIVSFDRHHDFQSGQNYRLSAPSPGAKLGAHAGGKRKDKTGKGKKTQRRHFTQNVRTVKI